MKLCAYAGKTEGWKKEKDPFQTLFNNKDNKGANGSQNKNADCPMTTHDPWRNYATAPFFSIELPLQPHFRQILQDPSLNSAYTHASSLFFFAVAGSARKQVYHGNTPSQDVLRLDVRRGWKMTEK